ncbi:MAG: hypothetical protein AAGH15_19950 [Myxococcota bacterium]
MGRKSSAAEQTAITTEPEKPKTLSVAGPRDELAAILGDDFDDLGITGLEETDGDDHRLSLRVWNQKTHQGDAIGPNMFIDTLSEETSKEISAVFLYLHKSNAWQEYNDDAGKNETKCRSLDRITGRMADGKERACKGCPDWPWQRDDKGKPFRLCGPVYTLVGVDLATGSPFLMRCRKTALKPLRTYLNRHFLGKRGPKGHLPLFVYETHVHLEIAANGNFATPVFTRGDVLDKPSVRAMAENAKAFREHVLPSQLAQVLEQDREDQVTDAPAAGGDASFNPNDFTDVEGGPAEDSF